MKEYIIHGVPTANLESILKDGFISINNKKKKVGQKIIDKEINQIFTQLIYRNIPYEKTQIPHWWNNVIVLDKKILKDYPFYSCRIGGFYDKFNNAFLPEADIFMKSSGKLKRIPKLNKLKNNIEKYINFAISQLNEVAFMHSHEIMFNKNIPLEKYCLCIIVDGVMKDIPKKIIDYGEKLQIPIKNQSFSEMGINNFIDIIEK